MSISKTPRFYLVGNNKGGCGKTLASLQIIHALRKNSYEPALGEVDSECKLSDVLGTDKVTTVELSKDTLKDMSENPLSADKFFNKLAPLFSTKLQEQDCSLVDLGATVSSQFLTWIDENCMLDEINDAGGRMTVVGVMSQDPNSLSGVYKYLEIASDTFGNDADYILIENDHNGTGFDRVARLPITEKIEGLVSQYNIKKISIPHAPATDLITYGATNELELHETYAVAEKLISEINAQNDWRSHAGLADLGAALGLLEEVDASVQRLTLRQEMKPLGNWLRKTQDSILQIIDLPISAEMEEAA